MRRAALFDWDAAPEPRRVIDFGWSSIKLARVEPTAEGAALVGAQRFSTVDREDGAHGAEIDATVQEALVSLGSAPIVVVVPSHRVQGLWVGSDENNPLESSGAVTVDVSLGRGEGRWVASIPQSVIESYLDRLGALREEVTRVVSTGQALAAAHRRLAGTAASRGVVVDVGAGSTVVSVMDRGRLVHEGHFPIAGETIVDAAAARWRLSFPEAQRRVIELSAENSTAENSTAEGAGRSPWIQAALSQWRECLVSELSGPLQRFSEPHQRPPLWLCGGGALTPGIVDVAREGLDLVVDSAPSERLRGDAVDWRFFLAVVGGALVTRREGVSGGGFAPDELASRWRESRLTRGVWMAARGLVGLWLGVSLVMGIRVSLELARESRKLQYVQEMEGRRQQLLERLETRRRDLADLEPVVERWRRGWRLLHSVDIVSQATTEAGAWALALGDDVSYRTASPFVAPTPPPDPEETNAPPVVEPAPWAPPAGLDQAFPSGVVAEVVFAQGSDAVSEVDGLFDTLGSSGAFASVDRLLPASVRPLVDPAFSASFGSYHFEAQWPEGTSWETVGPTAGDEGETAP